MSRNCHHNLQCCRIISTIILSAMGLGRQFWSGQFAISWSCGRNSVDCVAQTVGECEFLQREDQATVFYPLQINGWVDGMDLFLFLICVRLTVHIKIWHEMSFCPISLPNFGSFININSVRITFSIRSMFCTIRTCFTGFVLIALLPNSHEWYFQISWCLCIFIGCTSIRQVFLLFTRNWIDAYEPDSDHEDFGLSKMSWSNWMHFFFIKKTNRAIQTSVR